MNEYLEKFALAVSRRDEEGVALLVRRGALDGAALESELRRAGSSGVLVTRAMRAAQSVGLDEGMGALCANVVGAEALLWRARGGAGGAETVMEAFRCQEAALAAFLAAYAGEGSWVLRLMKSLIRETRALAVAADRAAGGSEALKATKGLLETAFRSTMMGKAKNADGERKRTGILYILNSQLKVFFGLRSLQLCRNLIKVVDMPTFPPMHVFPMSERVTYHYYLGRLMVFEGQLPAARDAFRFALLNCHESRPGTVRRIIEFLVPLNIFIGRLPAPGLLARHGIAHLQELIDAVRSGNVRGLDAVLERRRDLLIDRGLFLALDRLKTVAYRNLFRNVVAVYGASQQSERKDRVPLDVFLEPYRRMGEADPLALLDGGAPGAPDARSKEQLLEEIKCVISMLVSGRYMKGYVSHDKEMLVLRANDPFPALSTVG